MTETVATEIDNTSQSGKVHLLGRSAKKKHIRQASLLTLISLSLAIAPGASSIPIVGPLSSASSATIHSNAQLRSSSQPSQLAEQALAQTATFESNRPAQLQQPGLQEFGQTSTSAAATTTSASEIIMQSLKAEREELQAAQTANQLSSKSILANIGHRRRPSLFADANAQTDAQIITPGPLLGDAQSLTSAQDIEQQTIRVPPKQQESQQSWKDLSQSIGGASLQPQQIVLVDSQEEAEQIATDPLVNFQVDLSPSVPISLAQTPFTQQPVTLTQLSTNTFNNMDAYSMATQPLPPTHTLAETSPLELAQSFKASDFDASQHDLMAAQTAASVPLAAQAYSTGQQQVGLDPLGAAKPQTMQTLSQLTASSKAVVEPISPASNVGRSIAPILKPQTMLAQQAPPTMQTTTLAQTSDMPSHAAQAIPEDVFRDAFSQASNMHANKAGAGPAETRTMRSSRVFEKVHAFMNVAAVLAILGFVAIQRNKSVDLAKMLVSEPHLRTAFDTLCQQSIILTLFTGSLVFSLWHMSLLADTTSVYIACECSMVIVVFWMASGGLLLRKAQLQMRQWRVLEQAATNSDVLKLKEAEYERLYYQMQRDPHMALPHELISEMQHLVQRTQFVKPVHLPSLTESFLAKDFDFGEYLGRIQAKAVNDHFQTHFITLLNAIPLLVLFILVLSAEPFSWYWEAVDVTITTSFIANMTLLSSFIITFALFQYVHWDLEQVTKVLFPQILLENTRQMAEEYGELDAQCGRMPPPLRQPEGLNLNDALSDKDLFSIYEDLPLPSYLEQECAMEFDGRFSLLKCFIGQERRDTLSKHEILFGFTKASKHWHAGLLQSVNLLLVLCSAWTLMALVAEFGAIMSLVGDVSAATEIPLRMILPIVQLNMLVVSFKIFADWMPAALKTYSIATSTEMMKDRDTIEAVVQSQKREKNERNYRVFQAMRLMRREYMQMPYVDNLSEDGSSVSEEYGDELVQKSLESGTVCSDLQMPASKRLKEVTVKQILENFQKIGKPGRHSSNRSTASDGDDTDSLRNLSYRYADPDDANWVIDVERLHQLVNMCGSDLKKFESFYLLRRSQYGTLENGTHEITCGDFTDAVESYMNDANMDPQNLVLHLFKLKFGEHANLIYLSDVKAFLQEAEPYFQGEDLGRFIKDLELDGRLEGDRVPVAQIAAMIKHASDGFPK